MATQLFASEADAVTLRARLDALQTVWQLQHAPHAKHVSYGTWPHGAQQAEVLAARGKGWQAFGQHTGSRTLLFPEEALFLMESDRLVCYPGVEARAPMTLHAGYAAAAAAGVTPERYAAFAHLCRMGFVVRRCRAPWILDRRGWAHAKLEEARLAREEELGSGGAAAPAGEQVDAHDQDIDDAEGEGWDDQAAAEQQQQRAVADATPAADVHAPLVAPLSTSPPTLASTDAASTGSRGWWPRSGWEAGAAFQAAPLMPTPTTHAQAVAGSSAPAAPQAARSAGAPELLYDVWPPRSTFNKRCAGPPAFRLCVSTARPPSCDELAAITSDSAPVPVKCVIVRPGMFVCFKVVLAT